MLKFILLILAVIVAVASMLTLVRAPDSKVAWMIALAVEEFGHWFVLFPLGLAVLAFFLTDGSWRVGIWVVCALGTFGLFRPAFSAWRMGQGRFSWVRLYWHPHPAEIKSRTEIYGRPDGQALTLNVYLPPDAATSAAKHPGILLVHGGGWDSGDNSQLPEWNERWASRGWVVAAINYRLAPAHPWPAQEQDVFAGIAWMKSHAAELGLDPHRLVVIGRSAGGQVAVAAAYASRDPDIQGVIGLYAPHDMRFAFSVSREDDALNSVKLMRQLFGGPPDTPERVALYDSGSGQLLARADSPPTLLIHGYHDTLVWYRHSRRLTARLQELGVPVTHVEFPWATHAFDFNPDGPGGQLADAAISDF